MYMVCPVIRLPFRFFDSGVVAGRREERPCKLLDLQLARPLFIKVKHSLQLLFIGLFSR